MPHSPVRLAPAAAEDLREIKRYTVDQWGRRQWQEYLDRLDALFAQLATHPSLGVARDDVREGVRSLPVGSHVVWYRTRTDGIEVARILHASMDPMTRL